MTLEQARAEYIALYASDIRANPDCYKASVRDDPEGTPARIIEGLTESEVRRMTRELRWEIRAVEKATL